MDEKQTGSKKEAQMTTMAGDNSKQYNKKIEITVSPYQLTRTNCCWMRGAAAAATKNEATPTHPK